MEKKPMFTEVRVKGEDVTRVGREFPCGDVIVLYPICGGGCMSLCIG
jgi:hypothetical protein